MGFLDKIFGGSIGAVIGEIGNTAKKFITTDQDRMKFELEMQKLLQDRDSQIEQSVRAELNAKMEVLKEELQQGDSFTKRARPSVVYVGLGAIIFNYCIIPALLLVFGKEVQQINLPQEFWIAWGGIVSTWVIGRSAEKRGNKNKIISAIIGGKYVDDTWK